MGRGKDMTRNQEMPTSEILAELRKLKMQIGEEIEKLEQLLEL